MKGKVLDGIVGQTIAAKGGIIGIEHYLIAAFRNQEAVVGKRAVGAEVVDKEQVFTGIGQHLVAIVVPNFLYGGLHQVLLAFDGLNHCLVKGSQEV